MKESLSPNTTLSHYLILSQLGAGGMGEVWRARDTRLNREVAIKVLPASFANDEDRLRRFEQEALATSALNHPNILTVYDIGTHEGSPYIVAELLEGADLRAQLNDGALTVRKAIDYAQQITRGLAAAHDKGIVHRDLKPENLFLTKDGRIKILDFGLAKLTQPKLARVDTEAPTSPLLTESGVVIGTVFYMSPEQTHGERADHRADIFAFGAILYELVTGQRAFQGKSAVEVMHAILKEEPPELSETSRQIPPQLERIVRRCLEKKPERRFQSASDLAFALDALSGSNAGAGTETIAFVLPHAGAKWREHLPWLVAGLTGLLAVVAFALPYFRPAPSPEQAGRFAFVPPGFAESAMTYVMVIVSPDGGILLYIDQGPDGKRVLMVRPLDSAEARLLPGTEEATYPFWSPDSRSVAFFARGELKRVEISGGRPRVLCDAPDSRGGSWGSSGVIVFARLALSGLYQVPATGGTPMPVTTPNESRGETSHRFPYFLPDGRRFLRQSPIPGL